MKFIFYVTLICVATFFTVSWAANNPDDAKNLVRDCADTAKNIVASVDGYLHGVSDDT